MKEILEQYAAYHLWANEKLLNVALSLDETLQHQKTESSFSSLYDTFLHLWVVESMWWQRLKLQERIVLPEVKTLNLQEIANGLIGQSKQWEEWVRNANSASLEHVFAYYNSKKEYLKNPVWKSLLHLFNHASYHRGQIVTILHTLRVEKIPSTDFIAWSRKK
jgi:uncharacterized damage-inducible protein DinB